MEFCESETEDSFKTSQNSTNEMLSTVEDHSNKKGKQIASLAVNLLFLLDYIRSF